MRKTNRQSELELIARPEAGALPALLRGPDPQLVKLRMRDGFVIVVPMKYMAELGRMLNRHFK